MKKILNSTELLASNKTTLESLMLITNQPSISHNELIKLTSNWVTLFADYISTSQLNSETNLNSMKSSYTKLLSLGIRYNLDLEKHNTFNEKKIPKFICNKKDISLSYPLLKNPLFDKKQFLIVL
jgi:hypothetical protein